MHFLSPRTRLQRFPYLASNNSLIRFPHGRAGVKKLPEGAILATFNELTTKQSACWS